MRRLEQLINDIRFNSDNESASRYPSIRLMKLFNDAQREIQSLIVNNDTPGKWFIKADVQNLVMDQESYPLPSDIFALSYVLDVKRALNQGVDIVYYPLRMLSDKELRKEAGYILSGENVLMSPLPNNNLASGLQIKYVKKLPTLSLRAGIISSFTTSVSIQLGAGFLTSQLTDYDDFISVVDINGVLKQSNIRMTAYNPATGLISTNTALVTIANGDYVTIGKVSTSNSELPDICEGMLTIMVEKAMQRIDASQEFNWADLISSEQKAALLSIVAGAQHDNMYPPITDEDYLNT